MISEKDVALYKKFQQSPLVFIEAVWGLKRQGDEPFVKGKHISFQQAEILLAIEKAIRGENSKRIAIKAGRGIGKTSTLSWLILWYLFTHKDAQIACTAPTSEQMSDALWKEVNLWIGRMPKQIAELYEWGTTHLRIKERSATWFARARTARKENPEALAGIHGEYVMLIADEASGIDDNIFKIAEGSLTGENYFFILVSNPRRLTGYFYEAHKENSGWQRLSFNAEESPLVDKEFVNEIERKYGKDSDEYRIEVLGIFPKEDAVDEQGYVPLFLENDINLTDEEGYVGRRYMGVDPSGEGDDESVWAIRDKFRAEIAQTEQYSNSKSGSQKTLSLIEHQGVEPGNVSLDAFGEGMNWAREIALASCYAENNYQGYRVNSVNVGEKADDDERFLNKRAEMYFRMRQWFKTGGVIINNQYSQELKKELLTIRYKRNLAGKLQIMPKEAMLKNGVKSPNKSDALALSFITDKTEMVNEVQSTFRQYTPKFNNKSKM